MSGRMGRLILIGLIANGLSGCALLLVGAGVAGGYAISKDSVKNDFDLSKDHVYGVSREVVEKLGLITLSDSAHGLIKADVEGVNVTVTVKPVSRKTVELQVKARDHLLLPKVDVAQTIYNKIFERLQ